MKEFPAIMRTELWHPLSVHYPIALLLVGTLVGMSALVFGKKYSFAPHLKFTFSLLLLSGTILFWLSYYTGKLAYNIEVRKICDPLVLKNHLYWANIAAYFFSIAAVVDIIYKFLPQNFKRWLLPVTVFLMFLGSAALSYSGHLGASLVYDQGAAVNKPSPDCSDYELSN